MQAHVAFRVLWFTTVKACINTVMVLTGWKKSGVFKATPKLGEKAEEASKRLPDVAKSEAGSRDSSNGTIKGKAGKEGFQLHHIHDGLSKVTELRKHCMPFDGTLDFWIIMFVTCAACSTPPCLTSDLATCSVHPLLMPCLTAMHVHPGISQCACPSWGS